MKIYNTVKDIDREIQVDNKSIDELELSFQSYSCFKKAGIEKIGDFRKLTIIELLEIKNLNKNILDELLKKLKPFGIRIVQEKVFD